MKILPGSIKVKSNELLYCLRALNIRKGEVMRLRMSKFTRELYHKLCFGGFFEDLLMFREYKSGLCHITKVR